MMAERLDATHGLLNASGALLCHIDENEYERLHVICDELQLPNAGTVVWDKRNPMLGRKGVATQHEYVLWRTQTAGPLYLRNANQRLILEHASRIVAKLGGVTEAAREAFSKWIATCPGLSGGERANRYLNDDGRVYQSAGMSAPEPRTDAKFFEPLIHPRTGKPCPVPPYGWSRTPDTFKELLEKNEILFGKDELVQPRRKVFLRADSQRQVSSVIQDAGRGKADMDKLGLEFPYCHPLSLYTELVGAAAPSSAAIVLDFFAGSGTNGHAVIALNRDEGTHRGLILVEVGEQFDGVLVPRIKKATYSPEWRDGKPTRCATSEEAERSPRIVKVIRLES
jgi:adenine-specific DNA-methyltransferase